MDSSAEAHRGGVDGRLDSRQVRNDRQEGMEISWLQDEPLGKIRIFHTVEKMGLFFHSVENIFP